MQFHQHRFDAIEDYLHHRKPYLLIENVESIEPRKITTTSSVRDDQFYSAGHFPGAPILPGALMQEMTTQTAGVLIAANFNPMAEYNTHDPFFNEFALGVLVKVKGARFRGFGRPGDVLRVEVELKENLGQVFDFAGQIWIGDQSIMSNEFQLANILSSTLIGKPANASH